MTTDPSRDAFEKWYADYHNDACDNYGGLDCTNPKGIAEDAWQAAMAHKEAAAWQPIATAPRNQLVMVYTPPQEYDWPDAIRIDFDHIDTGIADGYWYKHGEHYEHFCCVSKPEGSTGPKEKAPYTHWQPLPAAPKQEGST